MIAEQAPLRATRPARRIVILGAAGCDFHNFNVAYRDNPEATLIAFTASQIPGIAGRRYPAALAGSLYPDGIPIVDEGELEELCRAAKVDQVVFGYSDVTHEHVMHLASRAPDRAPRCLVPIKVLGRWPSTPDIHTGAKRRLGISFSC